MVLCGLMAASLTVLKMAMSPLPNIEPVSLLVMVYAMVFGRQVIWIVLPFVAVEGLLYGFGPLWWPGYLYVWPLWGWLCTKLPPDRPLAAAVASGAFGLSFGALFDPLYLFAGGPWAAVASGAFGLSFGALFAPLYLFAGGPWAAVAWWISGIPFDLLHCAGNFALALALQRPLYRVLTRLRAGLG